MSDEPRLAAHSDVARAKACDNGRATFKVVYTVTGADTDGPKYASGTRA